MKFSLQQLIQAYSEGVDVGRADGLKDGRLRLAAAWNAGWHEHYLEGERQQKDPTHPITKNNPYGEPLADWELELLRTQETP